MSEDRDERERLAKWCEQQAKWAGEDDDLTGEESDALADQFKHIATLLRATPAGEPSEAAKALTMAEVVCSLASVPCYAQYYLGMVKVAREYGYALAVHGSMVTDLDVLATPWIHDAQEPQALANALREAVGGFFAGADENEIVPPHLKPHGRLVWTIVLGGRHYIDLSVVAAPRAAPVPGGDGPNEYEWRTLKYGMPRGCTICEQFEPGPHDEARHVEARERLAKVAVISAKVQALASPRETPLVGDAARLREALGAMVKNCGRCGGEGSVPIGEHFVTREMAIDGGDRSLEGASMGIEYEECRECEIGRAALAALPNTEAKP